MLLTAAMASCDAVLVGALIAAPCGVVPIVFPAPAAGVIGRGVGIVPAAGVLLLGGVVTTGGTVFTAMLTDASPLGLPAASVKAPAATETTPSVVLLRVGVKVAV